MRLNIDKEVARLRAMTVTELRARHIEVFGEQTRSGHKDYLIKRIAWRIQANAKGDLSARARQRAEELANDADIRTTAPKGKYADGQTTRTVDLRPNGHDPRVPMPGAVLRRQHKGREVVVKVLPRGFQWEGRVYRTLSAVAKAITGTHWNGYHFFNLKQNGAANE